MMIALKPQLGDIKNRTKIKKYTIIPDFAVGIVMKGKKAIKTSV